VKENRLGPRAAYATVLAPIAWGTTYVTVTELLPTGRPLLVAALRVGPAAVVLLMVARFTSWWKPHGRDWWQTAVLATFNFGAFFPLLTVAVYRLPGGVAAAAGGLQPLLVSVLSWPATGRRPQRLELAVGAIAAIGVAMVVVRPGAGIDLLGVLAACGANLSFAVGVVLTKRFAPPTSRLAATGWQLAIGAAMLAPLALVVEGRPPTLDAGNIAGLAYLSIVGTGVAFLLWFNGVLHLPANAPPLLGLAAPVTGAALGWALLGQELSPLQLSGLVITLTAIAYGGSLRPWAGHSRRRRRRTRQSSVRDCRLRHRRTVRRRSGRGGRRARPVTVRFR